ncbi:MAG: TetR/AcrR family transcriptional regulator [Cyanobacteria bacterium J06634_5]
MLEAFYPLPKISVSSGSYHHGHLHDALLQAAQSQIAEEGAQSLNLSKLARQLGVSQPAVYRHFSSKQALIFSLVERGFTVLTQQLETATESISFPSDSLNTQPSTNSVIEGIEVIAQTYIAFVLENKELARLMFSLKERVTDPTLHSVSKQAAVPLVKLIDVGQRCYGLKVNDSEQAVRLMWASIHGLSVLLMDEQLPYVTNTRGEISVHTKAIARLLYDGLFAADNQASSI